MWCIKTLQMTVFCTVDGGTSSFAKAVTSQAQRQGCWISRCTFRCYVAAWVEQRREAGKLKLVRTFWAGTSAACSSSGFVASLQCQSLEWPSCVSYSLRGIANLVLPFIPAAVSVHVQNLCKGYSWFMADLQALLRSNCQHSSSAQTVRCNVSACLLICFCVRHEDEVHVLVHCGFHGHSWYCLCPVNSLLMIAGRRGVSNCFHVADLMIAAYQTADAQEVYVAPLLVLPLYVGQIVMSPCTVAHCGFQCISLLTGQLLPWGELLLETSLEKVAGSHSLVGKGTLKLLPCLHQQHLYHRLWIFFGACLTQVCCRLFTWGTLQQKKRQPKCMTEQLYVSEVLGLFSILPESCMMMMNCPMVGLTAKINCALS